MTELNGNNATNVVPFPGKYSVLFDETAASKEQAQALLARLRGAFKEISILQMSQFLPLSGDEFSAIEISDTVENRETLRQLFIAAAVIPFRNVQELTGARILRRRYEGQEPQRRHEVQEPQCRALAVVAAE